MSGRYLRLRAIYDGAGFSPSTVSVAFHGTLHDTKAETLEMRIAKDTKGLGV